MVKLTQQEVNSMGLARHWASSELRVICPMGRGRFIRWNDSLQGDFCEIELDEPFAGKTRTQLPAGEVVADSLYFLARIIYVGGVGVVTSGFGYPSWEELSQVLHNSPIIGNEYWLGLNFETRSFEVVPGPVVVNNDYQIWEIGLSQTIRPIERPPLSEFDDLLAVKMFWEDRIKTLAGSSGPLILFVALHQPSKEILARKIIGVAKTICEETYWDK